MVSEPTNSSILTSRAFANLTAVESLISFEFPYKNEFRVENGISAASEISFNVMSFSSTYINKLLLKADI